MITKCDEYGKLRLCKSGGSRTLKDPPQRHANFIKDLQMARSQPSEGVRSSDFGSGQFWDSFLNSENFSLIQYGLLS